MGLCNNVTSIKRKNYSRNKRLSAGKKEEEYNKKQEKKYTI